MLGSGSDAIDIGAVAHAMVESDSDFQELCSSPLTKLSMLEGNSCCNFGLTRRYVITT